MRITRRQIDPSGSAGDPMRSWTLAAMAATERQHRLDEIATAARDHVGQWLDFGVRNRVGPIVAHAISETFPGSEHADRARAVHDASAARMAILCGELDRVAAKLAPHGIRMVALKNAGIARGIFPCAACCPMGDIDTLIARDRFYDAHALVQELGYDIATRAPDVEPADVDHGYQSGGSEYLAEIGGEQVWLEVQWRPVAGRWIRPDQEPDSADLIARSVSIPGTDVRLLSPEDNMLQVALHTAKHSYVRAPGLRLHTDVDRLATFTPPNWDRLMASIQNLTVATATYFSFAAAVALLGSPVPNYVLNTLAPSPWRLRSVLRLIRNADVFEPDQKKFNRPEMMLLHALMYDNTRGLVASAMDTTPDKLGVRYLPGNLVRGATRVRDIVKRYQR